MRIKYKFRGSNGFKDYDLIQHGARFDHDVFEKLVDYARDKNISVSLAINSLVKKALS